MRYRIEGKNLPVLTIDLNSGEKIYAQSGAMAWMQPQITFEAKMKGGFLKSLGRGLTGESVFQTIFTANEPGELTLSMTMVGTIRPVDISSNGSLICQKTAFLCAEMTVNQEVVFTKKFSAGLFGGEGFILQKLSGTGMAFLEVTGEVIEKNLEQGEVLIVDNGHLVAFEPSVNYSVQVNKGLGNILFSGEGLTTIKLVGPGKILLQSMTASSLASAVSPFISRK